jgi:hypothetical protein
MSDSRNAGKLLAVWVTINASSKDVTMEFLDDHEGRRQTKTNISIYMYTQPAEKKQKTKKTRCV